MFVDTTRVRASAGKGGDGCMSFLREAFIPRGGPDGGDGGRGGSIILRVTRKVNTLASLARNKTHRAQNGKPGQGRDKTGKSGKNLILKAPPGTIMRDAETGEVIRDLLKEGEKIVLAAGGVGGKGNRVFATATDQGRCQSQCRSSNHSYQGSFTNHRRIDSGIHQYTKGNGRW